MARNSVISLTSQYWKIAVGVAGLVVGSFAPLFEASRMSWTVGTILACAGYAYTCIAVRCPDCGSRWLWRAALDAGLYRPLFRASNCPACKVDFAPSGQNS